MTLPEWVDPASPDDPRPAHSDEDARPDVPPDGLDSALTEKPVLEWTSEDWARWIESSASSPAPEPELAEESAGSADDTPAAPKYPAEDSAADEGVDGPVIDVDVEAGSVQWPPLPSTDDERTWDEESAFPIVDIRLPEDDAAHSVADGERPWDEPPGLAVEAAEPVVDRHANLAEAIERPWDEPPGLTTEAEQEREPVGNDEPLGEPPSLFGVAGRQPPFETAPIPGPDLAHPGTELSPPPLMWPLPADPAPRETVATAPLRPVRAAPAPPTVAPVRAEPAVVTVERSRRIRSALGLLVIAVTVGIIVAGLITVSVFAIGVALRRALG